MPQALGGLPRWQPGARWRVATTDDRVSSSVMPSRQINNMTLEDKDKSTAVLVLHDEALDSHPFLAREYFFL